jgi:catechol 2,3-dioxygenase-like lactoylglutathione lyase family enzyme
MTDFVRKGRRFAVGALAAVAFFSCSKGVLLAQEEHVSPVFGPVVKYSNLIVTVDNVERSAAFYRNVFGLEMLSLNRRAAGDTVVNPYVARVSASPLGMVFASAILKLPGAGFNLLLTEFTNVDRDPTVRNVGEPGTAALILTVRDVDRTLESSKSAGARIVTQGGAPVELSDHSRSVVVRDLDGFLLQLVQPAGRGGIPESGNVLSASVRITVGNLEKARAFYRETLGFAFPAASDLAADSAAQKVWGLSKASWRASTGGLPIVGASYELIEFSSKTGGPNRKPMRLRDPGTAAFSMSVRDVDELLSSMKARGARIVSAGAEPVMSPNGGRNIFVQDRDGFFLELEGTPPTVNTGQ